MRRIVILAAMGAALVGCESTPNPTTAEGTASVHALRAGQERCASLGYTPGSAEMVACMRAAEQTPDADETL